MTPIQQWDDDWDDEPHTVRHLFSAAEAERVLDIKAATVRSWARRGQLHPFGLDEKDRPLYDRDHLVRLSRS